MVVKREDGREIKISELKSGDIIRCIIRFQGISQVSNRYNTKLRLQHNIP